MNLFEAVATATRTGIGGLRKTDAPPDRAEEVGWGHAITGIVVLIAVQLALVFWPVAGMDFAGEVVRDLLIVAFAGLIVPFVLYAIAASMTGTRSRLPAGFLYLAIILSILQVISGVLSTFNVGGTFMLAVLGVLVGTAARSFFKLGTLGAIVIAVLVVVGFIGAGMLLLLLPSGRHFL